MRNYELRQAIGAFKKYGLFSGLRYLYYRCICAPRLVMRGQPIDRTPARTDLSMHMLFGSRDFLMALWSLASFYQVFPEVGVLVIHSDGSLTRRQLRILAKLLPHARIEDTTAFLNDYGSTLGKYPALVAFRRDFKGFQAKKLIDQYVVSDAPYRIVLDADMLWFRTPDEMVESLRSGIPQPRMMSNGDTVVPVFFADGSETAEPVSRANSGIVMYRRDQFSLDAVAAYVARTDYLNKKFTDQACFASVLKPILLDDRRYCIKGELTSEVVMRHYTSPQRQKFYLYGLDRVARAILGRYVRN